MFSPQVLGLETSGSGKVLEVIIQTDRSVWIKRVPHNKVKAFVPLEGVLSWKVLITDKTGSTNGNWLTNKFPVSVVRCLEDKVFHKLVCLGYEIRFLISHLYLGKFISSFILVEKFVQLPASVKSLAIKVKISLKKFIHFVGFAF